VSRFDSIISRIKLVHTKLEGELELPLSELVKQELIIDNVGYHKLKSETFELKFNNLPFNEFPSLHSAELLHLNFAKAFENISRSISMVEQDDNDINETG
jgi:hypothetical protein